MVMLLLHRMYLLHIPLLKQNKSFRLPENCTHSQRNGDVQIDYVYVTSIIFFLSLSWIIQKEKLRKKYEKSGETKVINIYLYVNFLLFFAFAFVLDKIKSIEVNNNFSCVLVQKSVHALLNTKMSNILNVSKPTSCTNIRIFYRTI